MEKLGIVSEGSDSYIIDINFSVSIIFSPPKPKKAIIDINEPKKAIIDVNEPKQHIKASTIAVVQILEELSEDVAQHFVVSNSKFYKTLDFFLMACADTIK
jgi:hypothetical protein